MTAVALELEQIMSRLKPEAAERLEARVRKEMALVERQGELPTLEEMKRRKPEFADLIGCLAGMEFDIPAQPPLPPAQQW